MPEGTYLVRDLMSADILSIAPDATVGEAVARMEENGVHELPVMTNSTLKGWMSYRSILRRGGVPMATKVSHIMEQPARVQKDADSAEAAELFIRNNAAALPVVNTKGQVVGILSRTNLLEAALGSKAISGLSLAAVMNTELETVTEGELVDQAVGRLRDLHINQLLVLDGEGRLLGHVTLEDLLKVHSAEHQDSAEGRGRKNTGKGGASKQPRVAVGGLVKKSPTFAPTTKLKEAIRAMTDSETNFVVVAEDGLPVGVVSRSNIIERLAATRPQKGFLCQVVGLHGAGALDLDPLYEIAQHSVQKLSTSVKPLFMTLHYKVYKAKSGGDSKYALSLHFSTEQRFWVQKADAWNPVDALRIGLESLENRIMEEKELRLEKRKVPRRKANFYHVAPA